MPERVERVLVVSKTHLDVGFTDLASLVRRRYLDEFFPRALAVAEQLRRRGGPERLRWTTGSWILTEALEAADPAGRRRLDEAIEAGDLCWHALPFTMHTELCERSLLEHGLTLARELDRRYGRRTRAAKVTDVPGHTRGLVSVLAAAGVDLLHVGVNPAAATPQVPERFRWRDEAARDGATRDEAAPGGSAPEVRVMYQPGGYGAVQVVPGTGTAVAVDLTGDNLGPPTLEQVLDGFEALRQRFPDAEVEAATFDDVAAVMAAAPGLPVVTGEIGDTWIHGVASDPAKTAGFLALCRERRRWLDEGVVAEDDPALAAASTQLLLVAEHTWGLDQKAHWPEEGAWSAAELAGTRTNASTRRFEQSWAEQRAYLDRAVEALAAGGRTDLAGAARRVLAGAAQAGPVELADTHPVGPGEAVRLGDLEVVLDDTGAVAGLRPAGGGAGPAEPGRPLGRVWLQTFDADDFERWFGTYNATCSPEDEWWARWDNTKPGLERTAAVSRRWPARLAGARTGRLDGRPALVAELAFDVADGDPVEVPGRTQLVVTPGAPPGEVRVELRWGGLAAARWPVAWWWSFDPAVPSPEGWSMTKLGEEVAPGDVVDGGGRTLHVVERVRHPSGVALTPLDAPLVAPGEPALLRWSPEEPVDLSGGWHFLVHANLWGTNFPMWMEGAGRAAVLVRSEALAAGAPG